jgi:hypothetical protein
MLVTACSADGDKINIVSISQDEIFDDSHQAPEKDKGAWSSSSSQILMAECVSKSMSQLARGAANFRKGNNSFKLKNFGVIPQKNVMHTKQSSFNMINI